MTPTTVFCSNSAAPTGNLALLAQFPPGAPAPSGLLTVEDVAPLLQVSVDFVRTHAAEIGGSRIGNPKTGPLRFRRRDVEAYIDGRQLASPTPRRRRKPGPRRGVDLLPLPDRCER
jgi:hypothetical protein